MIWPWVIVGGLLLGTAAICLVVLVVQQCVMSDPDPDPVDAVHDGYERAKYFTDEEAAELQATATPPAVVAGEDLRMSILVGEIYRAFNDYREGREVCTGAPREPSPEVKR